MAAATPDGGVKSQATDTGAGAAGARRAAAPGASPARAVRAGVLAALVAVACGPPAVDARAVWLASRRGPGGARTLTIYDAGRLGERELVPSEPDPDTDALPLVVEFDPRGQGALVRAGDGGWQHELGDSTGRLRAGFIDIAGERTVPLALPAGHGPTAVAFAAAGGALWWTEGCPGALAVVPLGPQVAAPVEAATGAVAPLVWPLPRGCADLWGAVGAADAPVLFALEGVPEDGSLRPGSNGHVLALTYPTSAPAGGDAPALKLLRAARLPAAPLARLSRARCHAPGPSCGLAVVDPDGRAVTLGGGDDTCRLWRWSLTAAAPTCAVPPDAPTWAAPDRLVAAISPTRYLFREGLIVRRYDHVTGEHDGRPLVGDTSELFVRAGVDGRAFLFITIRGAVLRADDEGLELLSVEQRPCPGFQPPVVSPSATFVAWTCTIDPSTTLDADDAGLSASEVVRVSAAGMERFLGVPMWALAIDDDGDLLLHSRDDQDFSLELLLPPDPPRNLYVLSEGGQLARIDALEPDPELMRGVGSSTYRWIAAQAL